ncbi:ABC transporter ATP-binding protein [Lacticaseibacillus saniviri]|uniref:ABC transporter ATPase n=1 Tax=Lacticaseibacillus saniviri JCM 17471 = DSM 24301 TaxID=1293598 RepID=A0A0R2MRY5_9LACO|nr:ABC transporter ATP-binding protein [Lacticaseibacillus saniviri]KRO16351.1 ABC transporter ATPase [Lacticaseibacillus saniviri JCM 17471 = DSM 24301]MCG4282245.1 ABC transporter ATP-binding protein [Lacticaseibacillus saniviri]
MNELVVKQLHQYFERGSANENHALKGIDLTIAPGEFVTVIGGNGAGKSTLLNSIAGSLPVTTGQIVLDGHDITYDSVNKRAKYISRVFQDPKMGTAPLLTVEENMALAAKRGQWRNFWQRGVQQKQRGEFQAALKTLDLGLENRLTTEIGLLSGGQRQAITLLMATMNHPELLLLDEHTAALDPKTSATVMHLTEKLVNQAQLKTLMITHNMQDAIRYGNRLLMLDHGQVVVDVAGEEKANLTVPDLLALFQAKQKTALVDDAVLLS